MTTPVDTKINVHTDWKGPRCWPDKSAVTLTLLFQGAKTSVSLDSKSLKFTCRKYSEVAGEKVSELDGLKLSVEQIRNLKIFTKETNREIPLTLPEEFDVDEEYNLVVRATDDYALSASLEIRDETDKLVEAVANFFLNSNKEKLKKHSTEELKLRFYANYKKYQELEEALKTAENSESLLNQKLRVAQAVASLGVELADRGIILSPPGNL